MTDMLEARFFKTPTAFRKWLERNHDKKSELWVGFYKKASGRGGMVYQEALDVALCYGWIDGKVQRIDEDSYRQRFTPRKKGSGWSQVNVKKVAELKRQGLMHPAGLEAFEQRRPANYPPQNEPVFTREQEMRFKANKKAWEFFQAQPPGYKRNATWWVVSFKRQETRDSHLDQLIADSAAGRRLKHLA
ncbi:MAG: YdeI/OmpD-associated family protein [Actinomycetota bacterium]